MDKKTQNGKKTRLNWMVMMLFIMLIPASMLILNAFHWGPALVSSPIAAPMPASPLIQGESDKSLSAQPEAASKPRQQIQPTEEGNLVHETYDDKGRRVSKTLSTPEGILLNRWDFDPARGRIIRYEVNEYRGEALVQRRVARWQYAGKGGFVKTNQFFDSTANPRQSFVESVNSERIKYKEEWFDEKKRLTAEKRWDPQTGNFVSYFMTAYNLGGWSKRTYLDENGKALREVLLTPQGKSFTGGVVRIGK